MKIRKAADMLAPLAQIPPPTTLDMLLRLGVTIALAGAVGWERRAAHKPVGSRTMILTAVGAATFIMLGEVAAARAQAGSMNADPTRVLAYLVVGIGFLGGGAILHSRHRVRGMTTAATFWVTAAIGAAAGMGEFVLAAMMTTICFVTLALPSQARETDSDPGGAENERSGSSDPEP